MFQQLISQVFHFVHEYYAIQTITTGLLTSQVNNNLYIKQSFAIKYNIYHDYAPSIDLLPGPIVLLDSPYIKTPSLTTKLPAALILDDVPIPLREADFGLVAG